jgi:hypothetical protein
VAKLIFLFTLPGTITPHNFEISHQDTKTQSYIKGLIKKNPWCLCALVAIFKWVKTYHIAIFSFPCMAPAACNKRIFYNPKALNDNTFPFFDVPWYLNPPFPKSKYTISHIQMKNFPTKVERLPTSNAVATTSSAAVTKLKRCRCQPQTLSLPTSIAVVTKLKHTMSRGRNERDQEHHARQKFGWRQICQIRRVMALIYYYIVNICFFQLFFCHK